MNQLVIENALSKEELEQLESLAEVGSLQLNQRLLEKTVHACRLTTARKAIQETYLSQLKSFPETQEILDGICEVPLLAEEVTGNDSLKKFAQFMVRNPPTDVDMAAKATGPMQLYEEDLKEKAKKNGSENHHWTPHKGDAVRIKNLSKSDQYNGLEGTVVSGLDVETNRYGIRVEYEGKMKVLALQMKNMDLLHEAKRAKNNNEARSNATTTTSVPEQTVNKAKALLDDPEIKALVDSNPKYKVAVEDVLANPMNAMKYLGDPEMSPLISKAMSKFQF